MTPGRNDGCQQPWAAESFATFLAALPTRSDRPGPAVVAVDGRGGAGKSVLAERIRSEVPGSHVLPTDDIAWHLSFFDWAGELVDAVLAPLRQGSAVCHRPAAWQEHGRPGAIEVPAGCPLLILEGSGSGRRSLAQWLHGVIWVACDPEQAQRRLALRDGTAPAASSLRTQWAAAEQVFFAQELTWTRADVVVASSQVLTLGPDEIAVLRCAPGSGTGAGRTGQTAHDASPRPLAGEPVTVPPQREPTTGSSP